METSPGVLLPTAPARGPALSVVIPVLDEADSIAELLEEIGKVVASIRSYEILVVDDGSRDATLARLRAVRARGQLPLRILRHRKNLGQSAALRTGILAARAEWVVTLDGDAQNDPADIPQLLGARDRDARREQVRLVCGHRRDRRDSWSKRAASRIANGVRRRVLGDGTPDTGCGLKLIHRSTFLELPFFDHQHRFLPALVGQRGGRVISVGVDHRPRTRGRSKYGVNDRLWVGLVDLAGVLWLGRRSRRFVADDVRADAAGHDEA